MKITLGTTYYNSPEELKLFISNHIDYVDELIVVDDGSPIYPAENFVKPIPKLKLYKVKKDYGFNSHGCRNLIMKETSNDWVILLDIDRKFENPEQCIESIKSRKLKENVLYRFVAICCFNDKVRIESIHQSVNDFLINKNHFFKAGGYDEELISYRTGDRQYFEQLKHFGSEHLLNDVTMLLLRESTIRLKRNLYLSSKDRTDPKYYRKNNDSPDKFMSLINERIKKPDPKKPILTFEWERVF